MIRFTFFSSSSSSNSNSLLLVCLNVCMWIKTSRIEWIQSVPFGIAYFMLSYAKRIRKRRPKLKEKWKGNKSQEEEQKNEEVKIIIVRRIRRREIDFRNGLNFIISLFSVLVYIFPSSLLGLLVTTYSYSIHLVRMSSDQIYHIQSE